MPRALRYCPAGYPLHIVQRGHNRRACFASDSDMAAYVDALRRGAERYNVAVHAWVLMTNHVHLLLTPFDDQATSRLMQYLGRRYVQPFNFRYGRTGALFEGRFRSSIVESEVHLLNCMQYIELNPVRADMVSDPGDYHWSSYQAHAFGQPVKMWSPHEEYLALGAGCSGRQAAYRNLIREGLTAEVIQNIRHCLNTGLVLGSGPFREQIDAMRK